PPARGASRAPHGRLPSPPAAAAWRLRSHCHGNDSPQPAAHRGTRIVGSPRRRRRPPGASARTATAMIPHSRLLIAVPSSGLAQRAELLAYAALPLLLHERDEEVLDRRLHLTRPGDRSSALGEQPSHTLGVGTARSND